MGSLRIGFVRPYLHVKVSLLFYFIITKDKVTYINSHYIIKINDIKFYSYNYYVVFVLEVIINLNVSKKDS